MPAVAHGRNAGRSFFGPGLSAGVGLKDFPYATADPSSAMFPASGLLKNVNTGSGPWVTANKPVAIPFITSQAITVFQLGWWNGSGVMTDSADIGIYDSSFNRLVSTGSILRTGVSINQWIDVADTPLLANTRYYLAMANSGVTANQQTFFTTGAVLQVANFIGLLDSATSAVPLPNPLTNMVPTVTATRVPCMMMALRPIV